MTKKINKILLFLSSAAILTAPMLATISCSSTSDNQNEENTNPDGNTKPDGDNNNSDNQTTQKPLIDVENQVVKGKIRDGKTMFDLREPIFKEPFKEFPSIKNGYKSEEDYKYKIVDEKGDPIVYRISINAIEFPQLSGLYSSGDKLITNSINYDDSTSEEKIFFDVIFAEGKNYDGSSSGLEIMPPNGDDWPNTFDQYGFDNSSGGPTGPAFISSLNSGTFSGRITNNQTVECCFSFYISQLNQFYIDPFVKKNDKTGIKFDGSLGEAEKNKDASFTYSIKVAPK